MRAPTRTPQLKVVIDAIPLLSPLTGIGQYTYQLIRCFPLLSEQYEYYYYYGYFTRRLVLASEHTHRLKSFLFRQPGIKKFVRHCVDRSAKLRVGAFDLYFEPNFIPFRIKAEKVVATVHDFSFRLFPEAHPRDRVQYFEKNFSEKIKRASRIITDSGYTKSEAMDLFGVLPDMITPIHLGVDHSMFMVYAKEMLESCKRDLGLPEKFILFVGTREPRKNLDGLVRAYAELPERIQREFSLVLVGPRGWGESDRAARTELGNGVRVLNYVETPKLALIYNLASVFVYPSLYEGFGLPPLEAMACGCPVVVSRAASLPEVCADAAYYVDPRDVQSIAEGMNQVLSDNELRRSLIKKGIERAKLFTWQKTARKTLEVFDEVLSTAN